MSELSQLIPNSIPHSALRTPHSRLPAWLKRPLGGGTLYARTAASISRGALHTICEEAKCPNRGECWSAGTATFLILGDECTRRCGFCSVKDGRPKGWIDSNEPQRLAEAAAAMKLKHIVVTSVNRDDLPDKGASHFSACISALREKIPGIRIELLTPDFRRAHERAIQILSAHAPLIWGHNVETVPRLYREVRPGSDYRESLALLKAIAATPGMIAKSSMMLGLGETESEVLGVLDDLAASGVSRITIGQYLRPTPKQLPVVDYIDPQIFANLAREARKRGINWVISSPFARSSYKAELENTGLEIIETS